jgi:hypothetical protein
MRSSCRRQLVVSSIAVCAWVVVLLAMFVARPEPGGTGRLAFFAVLGVALVSTGLAVLPWMLAGYLHQKVLLYTAGYLDGGEDATDTRPELRLVH